MNQNTQMVDDGLVDLETGEVLDALSTALADKAVIEDLPRYARALRTIEARMAMIKKYQDEETERIQAICDAKLDKFADSKRILVSTAERLMKGSGSEKLDYPGLGVFRFGLSRESVNDDTWAENFDDDMKDIIQKQHPSLIDVRRILKPDKKAIKAELKEGKEIPGFSLNRKHETFTFKVEK